MSKRNGAYSREFNALLASPAMSVFREPERKYDAPTMEMLDMIEEGIKQNPYYVLLNDPSTGYDIPEGIDVGIDDINNFKVPFAAENTTRRFRVYYDTPSLDAYDGGVEIRIEYPKPTEHGHARPYKQVIKLGKAATMEDPTFHRIEIKGRLERPIPSFDSQFLDGNKKLSKFLKENFDCQALRPMQLLTTTRSRLWCRPGGGPDEIVEFGTDRGRAMTVNDFRYMIRQVEPEVIHGKEAILGDVEKRLMDQFGGQLQINLESKPSPGFKHLASVLKGNKEAKDFLRHRPREGFSIIKPEDCPALFPSMN